jgi:hypothetical protein
VNKDENGLKCAGDRARGAFYLGDGRFLVK